MARELRGHIWWRPKFESHPLRDGEGSPKRDGRTKNLTLKNKKRKTRYRRPGSRKVKTGHRECTAWPPEVAPPGYPQSCLSPPLSSCPLGTLVLWTWKTVRLKRHGTRLSHPETHQNCLCHPVPTSLVFYMLCFILLCPYLQPNCFLLNGPHFFPISFSFIHNLLVRLFSLQLFWHQSSIICFPN